MNTPRELYRLDGTTLELSLVGTFDFRTAAGDPDPMGSMTDIAVNTAGDLFGCSFNTLYEIMFPGTVARPRVPLAQRFNGLTFAPPGMFGPEEMLVGTTSSDGALYAIDLLTGTTDLVGTFGGTWVSAGDVVAVRDVGVFVTVRESPTGRDKFARLEPSTGAVTVIGEGLGSPNVWGLGYWGGSFYGFSSFGSVLAIDTGTGHASEMTYFPEARFWGAGVNPFAKTTH